MVLDNLKCSEIIQTLKEETGPLREAYCLILECIIFKDIYVKMVQMA